MSRIACDFALTPAMIEAGAKVLCRMEPSLATEEFWAKEIYTAMRANDPERINKSDYQHFSIGDEIP